MDHDYDMWQLFTLNSQEYCIALNFLKSPSFINFDRLSLVFEISFDLFCQPLYCIFQTISCQGIGGAGEGGVCVCVCVWGGGGGWGYNTLQHFYVVLIFFFFN